MLNFISRKSILLFVLINLMMGFCVVQSNENLNEKYPLNWCRAGTISGDKIHYLGKIIGTKNEKIHFYDDFSPGCPDAKVLACKYKSYVIQNDEVIISKEYKEFSCATFLPKKGLATQGWILTKNIVKQPVVDTNFKTWLGVWKNGDERIEITKNKNITDVLYVSGTAFWCKGLPNEHVGGIRGAGMPNLTTKTLFITEEEEKVNKISECVGCCMNLKLIDKKYMVVEDNGKCGGFNVSFTGIYRKGMMGSDPNKRQE